MLYKKIAIKYFKLFSKGDLDGLKKIYHSSIQLIDWNGEWNGLNEVLEMNKSLFHDLSPSVEVQEINEVANKTYCLLTIQVGKDFLKVMDVIDFDDKGKILKIEAFKG